MTKTSLLAGGLALIFAATPALADRPPTDAERTAIAEKLTAEGFTTWNDIEFDEDDNHWDIDDARTAEGREYDLKLAPETLEILERDLDD